ncbi:sensor histidine kinase [Bacteroides faecium]|uniref:histidine kinase n=1 Tax=Bacteroides faecium TaxID=2715212 RepID=A0A6H0KX27_9BACE|nr:HAMP domain-containing sensor histidine kinase [Bacteroides faecium]QIU97018.1 HAMP domain-containing histidine kinase [Bacteroides faecium]
MNNPKAQISLISGILLMIPYILFATVISTPADSLQNLLKDCPDTGKRAVIYVHLADIYVDSINIAPAYWNKALTEAVKAKDEYITKLALDALVKSYAAKDKEKVKQYIDIAKRVLPESHNTLFVNYLYCYNIWMEMRKNNSLELIEQELNELKDEEVKAMTVEEQIRWEYLTGVSLDYLSLLTHAYREIGKAIPYIERALDKVSKFPMKDRIHFEILCRYELSDLYTATEDKKAADEINKMIELNREWNSLNTSFERKFLDESDYYMKQYSLIIFLGDLIDKKETQKYYEKYIGIARKKNKMKSTYETRARYYKTIGDYQASITYIDSTILTKQYEPEVLIPLYTVKAGLYYKMKDYKNAYLTLKEGNRLQTKNKSTKREQQMAEMQTRFDVSKLELEKMSLAYKNKQIALIASCILLIGLIAWSIYQRYMVKRLKKMHRKLMVANEEVKRQSEKATESEKMKTAFLNSICHEIRTPLNSIAGFSELITDDSLDTATRVEFKELILNNSTALLSMVNNILELSELVSSYEPLPVEPTDVYGLCVEEMEILKDRILNPDILCITEADKKEIIIPTNAFYLSRVIGNLLGNAAKFTEKGTITLTCRIDEEQGVLIISITDTGIGIPTDKQEWVFERFTKVDDFKPGTGLGLYICRIIIQRLSGSISIDSCYTKGCKVSVCLPIK